jgi:hypothetical protein
MTEAITAVLDDLRAERDAAELAALAKRRLLAVVEACAEHALRSKVTCAALLRDGGGVVLWLGCGDDGTGGVDLPPGDDVAFELIDLDDVAPPPVAGPAASAVASPVSDDAGRWQPLLPGPAQAAQPTPDLRWTAVSVEPDAGGHGDAPGVSGPDLGAEDGRGSSVRALAATNLPPRWTEDEDAALVDMAVDLLMQRHHAPNELAAVIGPALGRPEKGTAWRIRQKLMDRISAARKARLAAVAEPVPAKPVAASVVPDDDWTFDPRADRPRDPAHDPNRAAALVAVQIVVPDSSPEVAPNVFAAAPQDDLTAHLLGLPRGLVWTWARDSEFCELMGLGQGWDQIAVELGLGERDVKARFDVLTGLRRDTNVRSYVRSAVIARMALLSGLAAAGAEAAEEAAA